MIVMLSIAVYFINHPVQNSDINWNALFSAVPLRPSLADCKIAEQMPNYIMIMIKLKQK